jgi:hypothetical protein
MAAESVARLQWLKADAAVTGSDPAQSGKPKNGTGHKTPPARVPKGNPFAEGESPPSVAE